MSESSKLPQKLLLRNPDGHRYLLAAGLSLFFYELNYPLLDLSQDGQLVFSPQRGLCRTNSPRVAGLGGTQYVHVAVLTKHLPTVLPRFSFLELSATTGTFHKFQPLPPLRKAANTVANSFRGLAEKNILLSKSVSNPSLYFPLF